LSSEFLSGGYIPAVFYIKAGIPKGRRKAPPAPPSASPTHVQISYALLGGEATLIPWTGPVTN